MGPSVPVYVVQLWIKLIILILFLTFLISNIKIKLYFFNFEQPMKTVLLVTNEWWS